jgi:hypothetical protein
MTTKRKYLIKKRRKLSNLNSKREKEKFPLRKREKFRVQNGNSIQWLKLEVLKMQTKLGKKEKFKNEGGHQNK